MAQHTYQIPRRKHFFSDGLVKALQEIPLLLKDPESSADTSKAQIEAWMQLAQIQDKRIGIKRSMIPCLPISILDHENNEQCFNLAKAIGETAQLDFLPDNHNQACWFLTLKYYRQALGVALAQKLYPTCLSNPFRPLDILLNPKLKSFDRILLSLNLDVGYRQQIANSLQSKPNCIERLLDSRELDTKGVKKLLNSLKLDPECREQFLASVEKVSNSRTNFCRYLPYQSVKNLIRSTEIHQARYRLIEAGFSLIKTKAKAEGRSFSFQNHTELFLQILKDEFQNAWLSNPLNNDYQWASKKLQKENLTAKIRILEGKEWDTDSLASKGKDSFFRLKGLPFNEEAKPQYLQYLKTSDWSGYWLYVFYNLHTKLLKSSGSIDDLNQLRKRYAQLSSSNQWSSKSVSEIPPEHLEGYVYLLWRNYLKTYKQHQHVFIDEFDWLAGEPNQSRITSSRQTVKAQFDSRGYIYWVWAQVNYQTQ